MNAGGCSCIAPKRQIRNIYPSYMGTKVGLLVGFVPMYNLVHILVTLGPMNLSVLSEPNISSRAGRKRVICDKLL